MDRVKNPCGPREGSREGAAWVDGLMAESEVEKKLALCGLPRHGDLAGGSSGRDCVLPGAPAAGGRATGIGDCSLLLLVGWSAGQEGQRAASSSAGSPGRASGGVGLAAFFSCY